MSDAAWMNIGPILRDLAVVLAAIGGMISAWKSTEAKAVVKSIENKTDDQTVMITQGAEDARKAAENTNGNLSELQKQLNRITEQFVETARESIQASKEHVDKIAEIAAKSDLNSASSPGGRRAEDKK